MRVAVYIDPVYQSETVYWDHLKTDILRRLNLMGNDVDPWEVIIANETYGDDELYEFTQTIMRYRDELDAVIIVPHYDKIELNYGATPAEILKNYYVREIHNVATLARERQLPVIAYTDTPGTHAHINLTTAGVSFVYDETEDAVLLPFKIAAHVKGVQEGNGMSPFGPFYIDMESGDLWNGINPVDLTKTERAMVLHLMRHKGDVIRKESMLSALYKAGSDEPDLKIVDVFASKIRRKLNNAVPGAGYDLIRTAWGDGYFIPKDIAKDRRYYSLLWLDPEDDGLYKIVQGSETITQESYDVLALLFAKLGTDVALNEQQIKAAEALNDALLECFIERGHPVAIDPTAGTASLNKAYFQMSELHSSDFAKIDTVKTRFIPPYRFYRSGSMERYRLMGEKSAPFLGQEIRLLDYLHDNKGRAIYAEDICKFFGVDPSVGAERWVFKLAAKLYKKLESRYGGNEDAMLQIYHEAYYSYGPAADEPTVEQLEARRSKAKNYTKETAGTPQLRDVSRELDLGYFTLLVHKSLGYAKLKGTHVYFGKEDVKILENLVLQKTVPMSRKQLFRRTFPGRPYAAAYLDKAIHHLRQKLSSVHPDAPRLVSPEGLDAYVSYTPDDIKPGEDIVFSRNGMELIANDSEQSLRLRLPDISFPNDQHDNVQALLAQIIKMNLPAPWGGLSYLATYIRQTHDGPVIVHDKAPKTEPVSERFFAFRAAVNEPDCVICANTGVSLTQAEASLMMRLEDCADEIVEIEKLEKEGVEDPLGLLRSLKKKLSQTKTGKDVLTITGKKSAVFKPPHLRVA